MSYYFKEEVEAFKNQLFNTLQQNGYKMKPTKKVLSVVFEDLNICVNIVNITFDKFIGENNFEVSFHLNVINMCHNKVITSYAFKMVHEKDVYMRIDKCLFDIRRENSAKLKETYEKFNEIAQKYFNREDLKVRNSDELDFIETSVWNLSKALKAAYDMGYKDGNKNTLVRL